MYVYMYLHIICAHFAGMTEYGWKRENGRLQIVWEVPENIIKSVSTLDFFHSGCRCKTGCSTRICSCKKTENVAPAAAASFVKI